MIHLLDVYCKTVRFIILCHNVCCPMLFMTKFLTCLRSIFFFFVVNNILIEHNATKSFEKYKHLKSILV